MRQQLNSYRVTRDIRLAQPDNFLLALSLDCTPIREVRRYDHDFGMRKLPLTAAEDLLEIIMRRYERASTLLTSNRPVEDWGKLLGDMAAVTALLDRILHHGHVLKCGPRSWRTKAAATVAGGAP